MTALQFFRLKFQGYNLLTTIFVPTFEENGMFMLCVVSYSVIFFPIEIIVLAKKFCTLLKI